MTTDAPETGIVKRDDDATLDLAIRERLKLGKKPGFAFATASDNQLEDVYRTCVRTGLLPMLHVTLFQGRPWITLQGRIELLQRHADYQGFQTRPLSADEKQAWQYDVADLVVECSIQTARWGTITTRGRVSAAEMAKGQKANTPLGTHPQEMAEKRAIGRCEMLAFGDSLAEDDDAVEPPRRIDDSPADEEHWRAHWFAMVEDTRLDSTDERHAWVAYYTGGQFSSLAKFLQSTDNASAERLMNATRRLLETGELPAQTIDGEVVDSAAATESDQPPDVAVAVEANAPEAAPASGAAAREDGLAPLPSDEDMEQAETWLDELHERMEQHELALVPATKARMRQAGIAIKDIAGEDAQALLESLTGVTDLRDLSEGTCYVLIEEADKPDWAENVARLRRTVPF